MSESVKHFVVCREWRSLDGRFAVVADQGQIECLLQYCTEAGYQETGGILIGRYSNALDRATVTKVTGPPRDSRAGRTYFERGIKGLQGLLNRLWRGDPEYYLGEWHFHPAAPATPSSVDLNQMRTIATSTAFKCPEPILLIVGGSPPENWTINVSVFPAGDQVQLYVVLGGDAMT